jgi:hypothetical protein
MAPRCSVYECPNTTWDPGTLLPYAGLKVRIFLCQTHLEEAKRSDEAFHRVARSPVPKVVSQEIIPRLSDIERLRAAAIREAVRILKQSGVRSGDIGSAFSRGMNGQRSLSRMAINKWEREELRVPADGLRAAALAVNMTEKELLERAGRQSPYRRGPKRRRRSNFPGPTVSS